MNEAANARKIALYLSYFKVKLKIARNKLSNKGLAEKLNHAIGEEYFTGEKVRGLLVARDWADSPQQAIVLRAIETLAKKSELQIDISQPVPTEIEDQFRSHLPQGLQQLLLGHPHQGDAIGELHNNLAGAWYFFYVAPFVRDGQLKAEIRSIAAFFPHATAQSKSINVQLISGHACWAGSAFVNDTRLYIVCTEVGRTETAFFLTNSPLEKSSLMIAGVGAALTRSSDHWPRPAAGVLCFGKKWRPSDVTKHQNDWGEMSASDVERIINHVVNAEHMADPDIDIVRRGFCKRYADLVEIKKFDATLHKFLQDKKVNRKRGFPLEGLYFEW